MGRRADLTSLVYVIEAKDVGAYFGQLSESTAGLLSKALNKAAPRARTLADRTIREQVAFPASYLRPSTKRLFIAQKASKSKLETVIEGRGRPTSLARFAKNGKPTMGKDGAMKRGKADKEGEINVEVKPGRTNPISRAWIISLPGSPDSKNLGLAVRTNGQKPKNAYHPTPLKKFGPNVWLLYGPSVDQVLYSARNNGGVITEIEDDALSFVDDEFDRLWRLENK